jgi:hypothetical protein
MQFISHKMSFIEKKINKKILIITVKELNLIFYNNNQLFTPNDQI